MHSPLSFQLEKYEYDLNNLSIEKFELRTGKTKDFLKIYISVQLLIIVLSIHKDLIELLILSHPINYDKVLVLHY